MIPKIVHLSWKDKDLLDSDSPLVQEGMKKLVELNPDWDVQISTDDEVDAYLQDKLEPQLYALIADKHIVQRPTYGGYQAIYRRRSVRRHRPVCEYAARRASR